MDGCPSIPVPHPLCLCVPSPFSFVGEPWTRSTPVCLLGIGHSLGGTATASGHNQSCPPTLAGRSTNQCTQHVHPNTCNDKRPPHVDVRNIPTRRGWEHGIQTCACKDVRTKRTNGNKPSCPRARKKMDGTKECVGKKTTSARRQTGQTKRKTKHVATHVLQRRRTESECQGSGRKRGARAISKTRKPRLSEKLFVNIRNEPMGFQMRKRAIDAS